ncbi:RNA-binding cell elongation regulator Jag/EloR [Anaerosacchariphilus polymeriproducens]|uniref:RNA-binding protein KhpB n=1 Tax=Anaerosacchariphilus polymeriproducens TaxID=1812858 RepID=A0A371AVH6_9FIRM|nr:RNA-binding cell elongation regulator Jag/EloR [Anaerosacchariphilus polymeriproducens]RDU23549.1 protein jag [Anaerosacchariphilus polymeriproducens]
MEFMEIKAKTVDDAITEALIKLGTTSDNIEYEVIEKGSTGFFGFASKPAIIKVRKKVTNENKAKQFLDNVFKVMNMQVDVVIKENEEKGSVDIDLRGEDMGPLIGKRGQTLDALQYLTSLVINKDSSSYKRVKVDTENYRKRRKDTLENLAKNIAYKVKRTKRSVSLEPMNPYERRVIHSALQNDKYVSTHSEGEDPFRHVVVTIKR